MNRVDPRVCGVAFPRFSTVLLDPGRSPRMRGSLVEGRAELIVRGSIPAYAG